jgi:hypothetical protein
MWLWVNFLLSSRGVRLRTTWRSKISKNGNNLQDFRLPRKAKAFLAMTFLFDTKF